MTFGYYLRELREIKALRQSDLAREIGVSTVYVCDIEKDRRYPPDLDKLKMWIALLNLSNDEIDRLYDLAGKARKCIAPDIIAYIDSTPAAKKAIRRIMEQKGDYSWEIIP